MDNVLVACSQTRLSDLLDLSLGALAERKPPLVRHFVRAKHRKEADRVLSSSPGPIDCLIVECGLVADEHSRPSARGIGGVEFVQDLSRDGRLPHAIVVVNELTDKIRLALRGISRCDVFSLRNDGNNIEAALAELLSRRGADVAVPEDNAAGAGGPRLAAEHVSSEPKCLVTVELCLTDQLKQWRARIDGPDGARRQGPVPLQIDPRTGFDETIRDLKLYNPLRTGISGVVEVRDDWEASVRRLGMQLFNQLFSQSGGAPYDEWLGRVENRLDRVRFMFQVDDAYFPVAIESLYDPVSKKTLMVESPMVRSVIARETGTLSADLSARNPLHVLCITSNVGPNNVVDRLTDDGKRYEWPTFPELKSLDSEKRLIEQAAPAERNVKIRLLPDPEKHPEDRGRRLIDLVRETLPKQPEGPNSGWDIVHFAGHCFKPKDAPEPFLAMSRDEGVRCDIMAIDELARLLGEGKTRLLYLSSCRSGAGAAPRILASRGLPALVAFRWDLPDDKAPAFADAFYSALFKNRAVIAEAFRRAKQNVNRDFRSDPVWASPMLVIQDDDWSKVAA